MVVASMKDDARGELLALADAGLRHAEGLSAQLARPDWKPSRAHIEQSRNSIKRLAEALRTAPVPQCEAEPGPMIYLPVTGEPRQKTTAHPANCVCDRCEGRPLSRGRSAHAERAAPPSRSDAVTREALLAAKEFADDEFSDCGDLNRKNRISKLCDKIDAALVSPPSEAGREAIDMACALARRLCQIFDFGGESQRTARARHASAIFQLLSNLTSNSAEWQKCDADPVAYLNACERAALSPDPGTVAVTSTHRDGAA